MSPLGGFTGRELAKDRKNAHQTILDTNAEMPEAKSISVDELYMIRTQSNELIYFIDARSEEEYKAGHIESSKPLVSGWIRGLWIGVFREGRSGALPADSCLFLLERQHSKQGGCRQVCADGHRCLLYDWRNEGVEGSVQVSRLWKWLRVRILPIVSGESE